MDIIRSPLWASEVRVANEALLKALVPSKLVVLTAGKTIHAKHRRSAVRRAKSRDGRLFIVWNVQVQPSVYLTPARRRDVYRCHGTSSPVFPREFRKIALSGNVLRFHPSHEHGPRCKVHRSPTADALSTGTSSCPRGDPTIIEYVRGTRDECI